MGLFDKLRTRGQVQPVPAQVGDWIDDLAEDLPMLGDQELLTLAALRAAVSVDLGGARSRWLLPGETSLSIFHEDARTVRSLLRVESVASPGDRILCGAASPLGITEDWTLCARTVDEPVTIDVPSYTTSDGAVPNDDLLAITRDAWTAALWEGPGEVIITPGPPNLDELVRPRPAPVGDGEFPLAHDYLVPVPEEFRDGAVHGLPGAVAALLDAVRADGWPTYPPDGAAPPGSVGAVDLGGGRPGHTGRAWVVAGSAAVGGAPGSDGTAGALVLSLPEESPTGRQRTFRAAVTVLTRAVHDLREPHPALAEAISGWVRRLTEAHRAEDRAGSLLPYWESAPSLPAVDVGPGIDLPVGLVVTGSRPGLTGELVLAQSWLLAMERVFGKGLRAATREANRRYLRRGPAVLRINGQTLPYLRYAHTGGVEFGRFAVIDDGPAWFWEVRTGAQQLDDGRHEGLLLVTGLARTADGVCYGPELLRLMSTFAWLVREHDPDVEIETIALTG
jgi:hypothetical protein